MRNLVFREKDLKTVYFNVDTEYESYQDRDKSWKRRFKGYKYNHHMKIEFAADNKRLGQVLYALAHSSLRPEFSIEYTVADVEKCKMSCYIKQSRIPFKRHRCLQQQQM